MFTTPLLYHLEVLRSRDDSSLHRAYLRGDMVRLRAGFYIATSTWLSLLPTQRVHALATARARSSPTVFCGEAALLLHGLPTFGPPPTVDLAVAGKSHAGLRPTSAAFSQHAAHQPRLDRIHVPPERHRVRLPAEAVEAGDFATLPFADCLIDVLAHADLTRSLVITDALRRDGVQHGYFLDSFREAALALPAGIRRERALRALSEASPLSESPGESASRALMIMGGLVAPLLQVSHRDNDGQIGVADYTWPQHKVIGEFDGRLKYDGSLGPDARSAEHVFGLEKRRENRLTRAGYRVVRWGWADLFVRGRVVALLRAAGVPLASRR